MNLLSKTLHFIGQSKLNAFVLQIGAMDGINFDDTRGYLDMYGWPGLFVEPIPEVFDKLKDNFKDRTNYTFENSAISSHDGSVDMLYVPYSKIIENELHPGYTGMASIFPPRNGFGSDYERDIYVRNNLSETISTPCLTLKSLLEKHSIKKFDILILDTEGHDWEVLKQIDFQKHRPKAIRFEHINLTQEEKVNAIKFLEDNNYVYEELSQDIDAIDRNFWDIVETSTPEEKVASKKLTLVTGLWNIGRPGRSFDHYLECFDKLLRINQNMLIFVPQELESFIWQRRQKHNTDVRIFELSDIRNLYTPFWDRTQEIRTSSSWLNQTGWLADSPQASLEWYNPIVMSKMSLLHDASIFNPFDTENFAWIDAGLTNTVNYDLLAKGDFFEKLVNYFDPFLFIQYPYPYYGKGVQEVHGFDWEALNKHADGQVDWICRGGLFGGTRESLSEVNSYYWHLLDKSLKEGYMGTEESLFSILAHRYPELCRATRININGHIQEFVDKVLTDTVELEAIPERKRTLINKYTDTSKLKVSVYMLTFNFTHQVEHTINTWLKHDKWLTQTRNILIDNSTNEEARITNAELCKKYNFEHIITNENTGINGGRLRAAQHFQESDSDYYLFLEDDMGIHEPVVGFCRNGFQTYVPNLYDKVLKILHGSDVDFLKLSYTEVYMDNNIQVSWYNVPQTIRTRDWPNYDKLPTTGLDLNTPKTKFDTIEVVDGLSYITGEIYYANWPTICGKKGNQKMFLDVTWAHPYEQTWMSYMYQETKKGNLKPAVLLASPINHNRIAHYSPEDRREN